jgi:hypothetical protein
MSAGTLQYFGPKLDVLRRGIRPTPIGPGSDQPAIAAVPQQPMRKEA